MPQPPKPIKLPFTKQDRHWHQFSLQHAQKRRRRGLNSWYHPSPGAYDTLDDNTSTTTLCDIQRKSSRMRSPWHSYYILHSLLGQRQMSYTQNSLRTRCVLPRRHLAPPANVTLFCLQLPVFLRRSKPKVSRCSKCLGYRRQELCTYRSRCCLCATYTHIEDDHPTANRLLEGRSCTASDCCCPRRCANRHGPHGAQHHLPPPPKCRRTFRGNFPPLTGSGTRHQASRREPLGSI